MTLVSGGIRFARIFAEVPRGGGVKQQCGCRQQQILAFSLAIFFGYFRDEASFTIRLHGYMQSVVGFSVIPKIHDLE